MAYRPGENGAATQIAPADPASSLKAVTPHASNDLPDGICRALWIGGTGNISIIAESDTVAVTLQGVPAGLLPVRAKAVRVSGTTATNIVALY